MSDPVAVRVVEIPELTSLILNYLKERDIVSCALVNRAWHKAVIPSLYQNVTIFPLYHRRTLEKAGWDGFQKYSFHMRELMIESYEECNISFFGHYCTNLAVLHLKFSNNESTPTTWSQDILKLVANNPGISILYLTSDFSVCYATREFYHHVVELGLLSAEYIHLDITGKPTRGEFMQALRDQVGHHAWCLKQLDIGNLRSVDVPVLVEILRASGSSLLSFRLWKSSLTDELLLVLSEYHGKTLERLTFGKCPEIFHKDRIEALLSRCPKLQLLHVFNCEKEDNLCMTMTEEHRLRWVGPDGKVFKGFTSDQVRLTAVRAARNIPIPDTTMDEGTICGGPWRRVEMMRKGQIKNHIRFVANRD
ncbi:hypothetical protein EC968_005986 [Mortierella alpina]|nr:hypothetical protein EC968_005986 [Mortierella alpina]